MAAEEQRTSRYTTSLGEHPLTEEGIASLAITPSGDEVPIIVTLGNLFYIDTSDPDNDERQITIRGGYHSTLAQALRISLGHRKNAHYTISDGTNLVGEGCTISQFLQLHPDGTPPHSRSTVYCLAQNLDSEALVFFNIDQLTKDGKEAFMFVLKAF
jgi:hypothetical protein